jgi:hypothetical protein
MGNVGAGPSVVGGSVVSVVDASVVAITAVVGGGSVEATVPADVAADDAET